VGGHDIIVNNAGLRGGSRVRKLTEVALHDPGALACQHHRFASADGTPVARDDCDVSGESAVVHFDASSHPIASIPVRDARRARASAHPDLTCMMRLVGPVINSYVDFYSTEMLTYALEGG
jgi:hypothetical protein